MNILKLFATKTFFIFTDHKTFAEKFQNNKFLLSEGGC